MKKLTLAILLTACTLASAQTTAFTGNLKDLVGNIPGAYVELSLKNCAGSGTTPTIPHVNGVGVVSFPVQLYPASGVVTATVYDETFIVCGSSTGVGFYHIAIYQGDSTRSLVKKLLFADDFDVQGASFNLNSASPRSGAVISPPVATAVLTNPAGNQTIVQPAGTALSVNHLSAGFAQSANGTDMIPGNRFTDTSPTGNFLNFKNAALSTPLWQVDVTGTLQFGIVPTARLSGTIPAASLPNPSATTLGGIESLAAVSHQWINAISTSGVPSATQPSFADISGVGTCAQEPALTGDTTSSSGSCATTTAKVNGVSYPASPSIHAVPVTTAANTETYKVVPDCTDTTGNHLNYTQSTDAFSCGTTVPANVVTTTGTQTLTGKTYGGTTQNIQKFTASGTFTIPANITSVKFILVGGGGAGGGSTAANNGGGGGSGGYAEKYLSGLTPGNTITVTVGGGGAGVSGANGNAGTASSIASGTQTITTVTANGGGGGQTQSGNVATPGSGATVSTNGDVNGFGVNGFFSATSQIGGAGASTFLGGGGSPGTNTAGGNASANTGSGGGGAGGPGSSFAGGNGASGIVIAEWVN